MQHKCPSCEYTHNLERIVKTHITKSKGKCSGLPIQINQIKMEQITTQPTQPSQPSQQQSPQLVEVDEQTKQKWIHIFDLLSWIVTGVLYSVDLSDEKQQVDNFELIKARSSRLKSKQPNFIHNVKQPEKVIQAQS